MISVKYTILILLTTIFTIIGIGWYMMNEKDPPIQQISTPLVTDEPVSQATTTEPIHIIYGHSVEGRTLEAYSFGNGEKHILFVGGIHGGYEWNTVLLAYELIDYLTLQPETIPDDITVIVVPAANPDGVATVVGKSGRFTIEEVANKTDRARGRFNANNVDLNRNFECNWQPEATWRGSKVSAGVSQLSEPESQALLDLVFNYRIDGAIFWHSQGNAVYASECNEGILPETHELMDTYAHAAGYKAVDSFDAYPVTGDAEGTLALIGIPAITVELATHETIEWEKNLAGFNAVIREFSVAK